MEIKAPNNTTSSETKTAKQLEIAHLEHIKQDAAGKEVVLFFGVTSAGKSTCISYLLGGKFEQEIDLGESIAVLSEDQEQLVSNKLLPAMRGQSFNACTLSNQIFHDNTRDLSYCDTVGFFMDPYDIDIERCATHSLQLMIDAAKCIKAVVVVIDWSILKTGHPTFQKMLYLLSQSLIRPSDFSDNLIFLVNKAPVNVKTEDFAVILARYKKSLDRDIGIFTTKKIDQGLQCLKEIAGMMNIIEEHIHQRAQNIIFLDLFDQGKTRQKMHQLLENKKDFVPKENINAKIYVKEREMLGYYDDTICHFNPFLQNKTQKTLIESQSNTIAIENTSHATFSLTDRIEKSFNSSQNIKNQETGSQFKKIELSNSKERIIDDNRDIGAAKIIDNTAPSSHQTLLDGSIKTETLPPSHHVHAAVRIPETSATFYFILLLGIGLSLFGMFLIVMDIGILTDWSFAKTLIQTIFPESISLLFDASICGILCLFFSAMMFYATTCFKNKNYDNLTEEASKPHNQSLDIDTVRSKENDGSFLDQDNRKTISTGSFFTAQHMAPTIEPNRR